MEIRLEDYQYYIRPGRMDMRKEAQSLTAIKPGPPWARSRSLPGQSRSPHLRSAPLYNKRSWAMYHFAQAQRPAARPLSFPCTETSSPSPSPQDIGASAFDASMFLELSVAQAYNVPFFSAHQVCCAISLCSLVYRMGSHCQSGAYSTLTENQDA